MVELDPAFHALARLHRALVEPEALDVTLERIIALSIDAIPGCDQASVTLATGPPSPMVPSAAGAVAVDAAQYRGGGPCVTAYEQRVVVSVPEIATDGRWPDFAHVAAQQGLRSSLSLPLILEDRSIGSINLYSTCASGFNQESEVMGALFAEQAAIALLNAMNAAELRLLADQLRDGMRHRDVIGQAKGILMAQQRITADAAFEQLKTASQHQNRKLRDVAEDLAATGRLPGT